MVVYQDRRNGNWDIYGYDLAAQQERRLTRNAADQTAPALSPRQRIEPGWSPAGASSTRTRGTEPPTSTSQTSRLAASSASPTTAPTSWPRRSTVTHVVWTDLT